MLQASERKASVRRKGGGVFQAARKRMCLLRFGVASTLTKWDFVSNEGVCGCQRNDNFSEMTKGDDARGEHRPHNFT